MASELKSGPLPADIEESIVNIMREEGVRFITSKVLRLRLEAKYNIEFTSHRPAIDEIVGRAMYRPEFKKQLDTALREREAEKGIGGKGKKRSSSAAADGKDAKKKKEEKPKKPDDYPKKPLSSYLIFSNDHREKLKAENPDAKITEILQKLGQMWSDASEAVKEKYKKLAQEDKERFERELNEYKKSGGTEFSRSAKAKNKDENAPKRAVSAFMFFSKEFRSKHPNLSMTEGSKAAGAAWRELSDEKKKPYEAMAQKDKERYEKEKTTGSK
ncbi:HMG box domain [Trypanosoma vivax]|uniref:Putative high mobility group protein n=1 Tax=Trypanosoma vivax (strain Y486) TaxID=1055687 RepID=G0TT21_TRYVY|nr:putative high mobility group protein [Trypanosoma vivax]KAH8619714.1 HMG box domain [Trypanosoma vivax]CCC47102.1 putative high mobility group protein [Trypanosoma vivax Y486]